MVEMTGQRCKDIYGDGLQKYNGDKYRFTGTEKMVVTSRGEDGIGPKYYCRL